MPTAIRSREVRFGVVMYGGVSLAIYINGVSQEFFRAVQGKGIYKLLKRCFDTDIVVDIISGTSAGGINGILLAYALANGKDFGSTKDLWRDHGDIARLLNGANAAPETCKSLLDSDKFYRAKLAEAFQTLDGKSFDAAECEPSVCNEMDVFVTGTSFEPDVYTTFDDAGRAIEMQDYRKVFLLKHRASRQNPGAFRPAENEKEVRFQTLAKLARITSSFPGAFLPVRVLLPAQWRVRDPATEKPPVFAREPEVDATLTDWGLLQHSGYFLDGGVLDNKPFTPTIAAIFGRTTDRPVDRILFYVEPDPEQLPATGSFPCEPSFASAVMNGAVGISTYQSTTDDARLIEEHNTQVVRHMAICGELIGKLPGVPKREVGVPGSLPDPQRSLYINARNTALASRAIRGLLRDNETGAEPHFTSAADRERAKQLFDSLNKQRGKDELSYNQTFQRYDIYFRLRRLHHVAKWLFVSLSKSPESSVVARSILQGVNRNIQLLEIVQYRFESALDRVPIDWKAAETLPDPWSNVWTQFRRFLDSMLVLTPKDSEWLPNSQPGTEDWLSTRELDGVNEALGLRVESCLCDFGPGTQAPLGDESFRGILQFTDQKEAELFAAMADRFAAGSDTSEFFGKVLAEYDDFVGLDATVFPLDFASNLTSINEVKLLRISPAPTLDDQNRGVIGFKANCGAEGKLAGRRLGHFSGFLKRSWRSNDILWGRLDALRHIVLALVTPEAIQRMNSDRALRDSVLESARNSGGLLALIQEIFPQSPAASHVNLAEFFGRILSENDFKPSDNDLQASLNLLVEMGQLEILSEEIGLVLSDAALQQTDWNRFQTGSEASSSTTGGPAFDSPPGYIDPALIGFEVEKKWQEMATLWRGSIARAAGPKTTGLGKYFEQTYDVAGEGLERGIPPLILAEYLTRMSLVLNACILGSLPPPLNDRIANGWPYKIALRLPLRISHRIVKLWIREPRMTAILLTAVMAAALVAVLSVGYFYVAHLTSFPGFWTVFALFMVSFVLLAGSIFLLSRKTKLGL
jgi:hypothetical protein